MKTPIILAHIGPHFHGGGAGLIIILCFTFAVVAAILAGSIKNSDK